MPSWADIDAVIARQRAAVAKQEATALRRVVAVMEAARVDLAELEQAVGDRITVTLAHGGNVESALRAEAHYNRMLAQLDAETDRLTRALASSLGRAMPGIVELGALHAGDLLVLTTGVGFSRLDTTALQAIIATATSPDSPLALTLEQLGTVGRQAANRALAEGIAAGLNPRRVATRIVSAARDVPFARARTIARTELLRAYRASELESYQAADGVITGWAWHADLSGRTCAACWAMHGTVFPTDEPMGTHPNCRCAMVPVTRRLGPPLDGPTRFAGLDSDTQRRILGPSAHRAYEDGAVGLSDLVHTHTSQTWGTTRTSGSLVGAIGPGKAAKYYRA